MFVDINSHIPQRAPALDYSDFNIEIDYRQLELSRQIVQNRWPDAKPEMGMIFGSGLGTVSEAFNKLDSIPYSEIPALGISSVIGHSSKLTLAELEGRQLLLFEGRRHYYEGLGWTPLVFPAFLLSGLGAKCILATNAAGAIRSDLHPGEIMLVTNHINLLGEHGYQNLKNYSHNGLQPGEELYDGKLVELMKKAASEAGRELKEGTLAAVIGPCFETRAEVKMLKILGADATGMSVVPSTLFANQCGLKAAALSCMTNYATGINDAGTSHAEVLEMGLKAIPALKDITSNFFRLLKEI